MSYDDACSTVQINYHSSDGLSLRKLPANHSFDFGLLASLVVFTVFVALLALGEVIQFLLAQRRISTGPKGNYVVLPWLRYFGTPQFFTMEYRYLAKALQRFPGSWFSFRVCQNNVVVVSGQQARHVFFNCQSLTFLEGYFLLHPNMRYLIPDAYTEGQDGFGWLLKQFSRPDVLHHLLLPTVSDAQRVIARLGEHGVMDPFVDLDRAVFAVSTRIATGNEIADDPTKLSTAHRALSWLQEGSTPHALILPWIPTPARFRGVLGGLRLHRMLNEVYVKRKRLAGTNKDVLQSLVDEDMSGTQAAVLTIMTILAAHGNTSAILSWFLVTLAQHPAWLTAVRSEIDAFLMTHHILSPPATPQASSPTRQTGSPADIPLFAWERALPTVDLCLDECLRLYMNIPLIRRNTGDDVQVAGRTIASGDYVMYMMEDAHLHGEAYANPTRFDPTRDRSRAGKLGFVAWGAGTHPCTGQRLAKLIIKVFVALLLRNYDIELVNAKGQALKKAPEPLMGLFSVPKPDTDVRIRYTARERYSSPRGL